MTVARNKLDTVRSGGRSLSVVIDVWIGLAFIVAMIVCAGVEYLRNPDVSMGELLSHHLLELLLFGSVLWGISWLVLRAVLVEPIGQIYQHLYRIGGGDHSPLSITTGVREIQEMVDAINIMLWRMDQDVDHKAVIHHARRSPTYGSTSRGVTALITRNLPRSLIKSLSWKESSIR